MDELQQDWDRQSELLERILDGEPVEDVLASEPDAAVREAVLSMLQHHREAEKTGFLDAPPTLVRALHEGTDGPSLKGGERLNDRFVILRHIGSGGMGEVYLARDEVMNDDVALKIIRPELSEDPRIRTRFIAEVRNARRVTHTNVCHVYDIVERAELPFFTMEYLPGRTLAEALGAGSLDGAAKKRIAAQLANGLDAAHLRGIIHRDFKPANVMLTERNGRLDAVIMDFGLARTEEMTDPGNAHSLQAGTEEYMAPELLQGSKATLQSDVYAYGKVLQQLLPNHPLLSKLLAERPEERQPSLRAVIASFDDANGKATRRTWMLGTAAAAATGYSAWVLTRQPTVVPPARQRFVINELTTNGTHDQASVVHGLLTVALRQSPLFAVVEGSTLKVELKKRGLPVTLPAAIGVLEALVKTETIAYILTGNLAVDGKTLKLETSVGFRGYVNKTTQLIEEVTSSSKVLQLAEKMSTAIRSAVGESLTSLRNAYSPLERVISRSPEAIDYYFEAIRRYEDMDAAGAIVLLERAVDIDPAFAVAHHVLALAYSAVSKMTKAYASAKLAFDLRHSLDEREKRWIAGNYLNIAGDWARAVEEFRAAVVVSPTEAVLHRQFAFSLARNFSFEESVRHSYRAVELDPFSAVNQSELIVNLMEGGRAADGIEVYERLLASGFSRGGLYRAAGLCYTALGKYEEAIQIFEEFGKNSQMAKYSRYLALKPTILSGEWRSATAQMEADIQEELAMADPDRGLEVAEWLMFTHRYSGYYNAARTLAQKILPITTLPIHTKALRAVAMLSAEQGWRGEFDEALSRLSRIERTIGSSRLRAIVNQVQAISSLRLGLGREALSSIQKAIALWPDPLMHWTASVVMRGKDQEEILHLAAMEKGRCKLLKHEWPGWISLMWQRLSLVHSSASERARYATQARIATREANTYLF